MNSGIRHRRSWFTAPTCLALLAWVGCSTPVRHAEFLESLEESTRALEAREYATAIPRLETLLRETSAGGAEYSAQRCASGLLLSRAHMLAAVDEPVLAEAVSAVPRQSAIEATTAPRRGAGSPAAHLVAAANGAAYAEEWMASVVPPEHAPAGQVLTPAALGAIPGERGLQELELHELVQNQILGFSDRVDRALDALPTLHKAEACDARLAAIDYPIRLRGWVHLALFDYQRARDARGAFGFAVRALGASRSGLVHLPAGTSADLRAWLVQGSGYRFVCPSCATPILPEYDDCQNCHVSTLQFRAERLPGAKP